MRGRRVATAVAVVVVTMVSGCSSTGEETPTPVASAYTPAVATDKQVASIIAGYETAWRDVIDNAGTCRTLIVTASGDAVEQAQATACYADEITMGISSGTASQQLASLTVPPSLTDLVAETQDSLAQVTDVDLAAVCGEAFQGPDDSHDCNLALGQRYAAYVTLGTVLDKWGPYL